ncbi:hypothetical protein PLANTIT3_60469 [Plantibacter sp. T3]|nr:hypothetical protein PLANTIT3_60469 [Plantibacter sp. T3]
MKPSISVHPLFTITGDARHATWLASLTSQHRLAPTPMNGHPCEVLTFRPRRGRSSSRSRRTDLLCGQRRRRHRHERSRQRPQGQPGR